PGAAPCTEEPPARGRTAAQNPRVRITNSAGRRKQRFGIHALHPTLPGRAKVDCRSSSEAAVALGASLGIEATAASAPTTWRSVGAHRRRHVTTITFLPLP